MSSATGLLKIARQRRSSRHPWSFAFSAKRIASMSEQEWKGPRVIRGRQRGPERRVAAASVAQ